MSTVSLSNLTKVYPNGFTAVDGLDLHIEDGEFLVLVGPSGCGKSTALRMVAGLEEISSGTLTIGGEPMNDVQPKDRNIAMVFQNYALYPHLDVAHNIGFPLSLAGLPKSEIDSKVSEAARILELEPLLGNKPAQLSGGQRQRVALEQVEVVVEHRITTDHQRQPLALGFSHPLLGDLRALEAHDGLAADVDLVAGRRDVVERAAVCSGRSPRWICSSQPGHAPMTPPSSRVTCAISSGSQGWTS